MERFPFEEDPFPTFYEYMVMVTEKDFCIEAAYMLQPK